MATKSKTKTGYVDGFVIVVPTKKLAAYKKMAQIGCKVWMDHGALAYAECSGQDMKVQWGMPFPKLTNAKKSETVVFSFITYKNKAHRDSVNKKVMSDSRLKDACDPTNMPFDMKKMAYGGFEVMIGA